MVPIVSRGKGGGASVSVFLRGHIATGDPDPLSIRPWHVSSNTSILTWYPDERIII